MSYPLKCTRLKLGARPNLALHLPAHPPPVFTVGAQSMFGEDGKRERIEDSLRNSLTIGNEGDRLDSTRRGKRHVGHGLWIGWPWFLFGNVSVFFAQFGKKARINGAFMADKYCSRYPKCVRCKR